jgi:bud site selection protein 20
MGQPNAKKKGARSKIKKYKRSVWLCNRDKDLDQIQDEIVLQSTSGISVQQRLLAKNDPTMTANMDGLPYDDELPGGGQYYCVETAKHFIDATALEKHKKTKFYKRRCKELLQEKYTQHTADWAAGKSKESLPPIQNNKSTTAMES